MLLFLLVTFLYKQKRLLGLVGFLLRLFFQQQYSDVCTDKNFLIADIIDFTWNLCFHYCIYVSCAWSLPIQTVVDAVLKPLLNLEQDSMIL